MADHTKTKTVNGTHGSPKAQHSQKSASKLAQLLELAKEISNDAVQDYETTLDQRRTLEKQVQDKDADNDRLREVNQRVMRQLTEQKTESETKLSEQKKESEAKIQMMWSEFQDKFKTFEANKGLVEEAETKMADMEARVQAAEAAQKDRDSETDKLKQWLQSAESHANDQTAEIKEMGAECELHRSQLELKTKELDSCKEKLGRAQKDLGEEFLHGYDSDGLRKLGLELKALAKKLHTLVFEYLNDLDAAKDSASEIQELKNRFPKIPLTTASTKAAASMRCAVAEAVFAEVLTKQIFVPFYLGNGRQEKASGLLDMFGDDERRRSIYRCQILQSLTDPAETARIEEDVVHRATGSIYTALFRLVGSYKQASFLNAVPELFREALRLWADVQRARDLVRAEVPDAEDVQPSSYEDYDQGGAGAGAGKAGGRGAKPVVAAVLFPQVATREDLIFNGMALWSNQAALVTAQQETTQANGGSPRPHNSRRRSVVGGESPFRNK